MLKEFGDEGKDAQGSYRVYDSLWNGREKPGKHRAIECLECTFIGQSALWDAHQT